MKQTLIAALLTICVAGSALAQELPFKKPKGHDEPLDHVTFPIEGTVRPANGGNEAMVYDGAGEDTEEVAVAFDGERVLIDQCNPEGYNEVDGRISRWCLVKSIDEDTGEDVWGYMFGADLEPDED